MRAGNNLLIIVITVMTAALAFYQAGAYAGDLPGEDNEDKMPESVGSGLSQYIIDQKNDIADDVGADPKSEFSPSSVTYNSDGTIATADFASDGVMEIGRAHV